MPARGESRLQHRTTAELKDVCVRFAAPTCVWCKPNTTNTTYQEAGIFQLPKTESSTTCNAEECVGGTGIEALLGQFDFIWYPPALEVFRDIVRRIKGGASVDDVDSTDQDNALKSLNVVINVTYNKRYHTAGKYIVWSGHWGIR